MVDGEIEKGEDVSNGFFACCFVTETKPSQIGMFFPFSLQIRPGRATRVVT